MPAPRFPKRYRTPRRRTLEAALTGAREERLRDCLAREHLRRCADFRFLALNEDNTEKIVDNALRVLRLATATLRK